MTGAQNAEALGSKAARQGAFLKALIDHSGNISQAAVTASVSKSTVTAWRSEPTFAAALDALRALVAGRVPVPRREHRFTTDEQCEEYLDCLRQGMTNVAAAERVGVSASSIHYRAARDEAFAARLHAIRPKGSGRRGRQPTPVDEAWLREAWSDGSVTIAAIARQVGLSATQLSARARDLGLPGRR